MGGILSRSFDPDSFGPLPTHIEKCIDGNDVTMFGSFNCRYCRLAHRLFEVRKIPYKFVSTSEPNTLYELHKHTKTAAVISFKILNNFLLVPQIFIKGKYIGSYDQLTEWDYDGKLHSFSEYAVPADPPPAQT